MCGFKLITSCLGYVARLPGSGVGFLVGSLCPLTAEIGHRASARARLSPSCRVTISARLCLDRKIVLRVLRSHTANYSSSFGFCRAAKGAHEQQPQPLPWSFGEKP